MNSGANLVPRVSLTPGARKKRDPGNEIAVVPSWDCEDQQKYKRKIFKMYSINVHLILCMRLFVPSD